MVLRLAIHRDFLPLRLQEESVAELAQSVSDKALPDSAEISAYLKSGPELFSAMGARRDILTGAELILGADSIRTDGDWLWREDLHYYFSRYHVRLPEEFIALIRERRYEVPQLSAEQLRELSEERRAILSGSKPA
ncbi:hypothetical protein [Streptomyces sp. NPDC001536]|uniref:hypothetical protein n=1 Tax=Streptomyces sp. NPDC001536 TaxID=3364583 RepID=UPI00367A1957